MLIRGAPPQTLPDATVAKGKRRASGEGTIRRRPDGLWEARLSVPGKRPKSFYGKTQAEVIAKREQAKKVRDGLAFDPRGLTMKAYLERWLSDSVRGSVSQRTYDDYEWAVRLHIVPELGGVMLKDLTPAHLQALYRAKLDSGLAPSSVLHIHRALHRALGRATRWRLIPFNPAEDVDPPRDEKREIVTLSREEVERFFRVAESSRLFALFVVAALTGLREGELLGLRWQDVAKDAQGRPVLRIRQKLVRASTGLTLERGTKTGKGRAVRLPRLGTHALKEHRKRQLEDRMRAGARWEEHGLVFTSKRGTPIDPSNLSNKYLRKLLEKAGLPRVRFHDLRHGFATVLFSDTDVSPKMVAEMLGHADISMTLNTYTHYLPTMQEDVIARLDEIFPPYLLHRDKDASEEDWATGSNYPSGAGARGPG